jgi:arginase
MGMISTFGFVGVPSSAGAHYPGQEKAPAALRSAGLQARLQAAGISIVDYGDLPLVRCRVDSGANWAESVADVRSVACRLADCIEKVVSAQQIPLVVGGDCTITIGVVAGFIRKQPNLALLYMDGGLDAVTPAAYRLGRLDSTGMASLLAEPGGGPLSGVGPRYPLMAGPNIVPFGYIPGEPPELEEEFLARHRVSGYPIAKVGGRAASAAMEARSYLERQAEQFIVHFDVDVIDFVDFPAADVLQPKQGMTFADTFGALRIFRASPKFAGLVITEFNPDHDIDCTLAKRLIQALAQVLR